MRAVTAAGFTSGPLPIESVESTNELPRASPSAIAGAGDSRSGLNLPYLAPYFLDFTRRARAVTDVPLMLTGGFETREQAADAVARGAVDIVSLARAMVLNPRLGLGLEPGARQNLLKTLRSVEAYALDNLETLSELDVNPVIVRSDTSVVAVDALAVVTRAPPLGGGSVSAGLDLK